MATLLRLALPNHQIIDKISTQLNFFFAKLSAAKISKINQLKFKVFAKICLWKNFYQIEKFAHALPNNQKLTKTYIARLESFHHN